MKPGKQGSLSAKVYHQDDCKLFRFKTLSYSFYKEPMGGGIGETYIPPDRWIYPPPQSGSETILKSVCSR